MQKNLSKHKPDIHHMDFNHHAVSALNTTNFGFLFTNSSSLWHTHDDFAEFSLITSGEWENEFEGTSYRLSKNSLVFFGEGTMHSIMPVSPDSSHFTFYFKEEYLRETISKFFPNGQHILTTKYRTVVLPPSISAFLLYEAHKMNGARTSANHDIEFQNYMHNLIYFMFYGNNIASESPTTNVHARTLCAFFNNYLYLDEPLKAMYAMFPVSPATLIKQFENETGQTIAQYRNDKRMEYASLLLKDHKMTIAAVANTVGISNPSHFALEFRKKFGVSPKEFTKRHRTPQ